MKHQKLCNQWLSENSFQSKERTRHTVYDMDGVGYLKSYGIELGETFQTET